MTPLADFLDRHPIATGAAGASAGLLSWLAETLHIAAGIAADLGVLAGAGTSVLIFAYWLTKREDSDERARRNREQRRRHFRDEPFDDSMP